MVTYWNTIALVTSWYYNKYHLLIYTCVLEFFDCLSFSYNFRVWLNCLLYNFYWELQCAYFWGVLWIFSSDGFLWLGTFLKINDGFLWSFTINDWVHLWSFMIINDGFLWLGTFGKLYTHKWWFLVIGYFSRSLLSF